ncbi:MAG: 4-hydroxybutyrate CoA-transferase [Deltaproteobacteria bacterium]|nr:4-hydroxybutyrate CoA-transferase [Deltaproteobacteria bacterium]
MPGDWRKRYREKLVTADEALRSVKSDYRVLLHTTASEPPALMDALAARGPAVENVEVISMFALGKEKGYARPEMARHFHVNCLFVSPPTRQAVHDRRGDFTPCLYSEIPRLFTEGILPVDVFLIQVSPPDENGYCSFGLSADYARAGVESAKVVIAQMNRNYPRTNGDKVHLDEITYIVEEDSPVFELVPPKVGEIERRIARNVAGLIPDGATLQLGIGGIPDTVLTFLTDKKDLGIHSEMFSDGVVTLAEAGVITNKRKTLHPGKFICTFLMGTRKLYDFVNGNPDVEMRAVDYVNDPCVIGRNDTMISVNSALQIDLTGQINAETIGNKMYSGIGGQLDFVIGASRSKGGKAIFALSSTASNGAVSRITCELARGAGVTTPRGLAHYVVTEQGIADLRGKSLRQRAAALIAIAHPDFREPLTKEAWQLGLL